MKEKRWRILWIDNQINDEEQPGGRSNDSYPEKQKGITPKPYVRFLEYEGYDVSLAGTNAEGIALIADETYHAVLLNYNAAMQEDNLLARIRDVDAHIPIMLLTHENRQEVMQQASLYNVGNIFMMPENVQVEASSKQLAFSLAFLLEKQGVREAYTPQAYVQNFNRTTVAGGKCEGAMPIVIGKHG